MAIDRRGRSTYVPLRLWRSRRGPILIYQHASLRIVAIAERDVLVIWGWYNYPITIFSALGDLIVLAW